MKRIIIIAIVLLAFVGCNRMNSPNDTVGDMCGEQSMERQLLAFNYDTISFFGKTLVMDDSAHIIEQIKDIVDEDEMLTIKDNVITVCKVGFGINIHDNGVLLISSTQVDDPKIKTVVKYLNTLYGTASKEEFDNYWWCKNNYNGNTIRLHPLHSEEGGTVILFYK